MASGAHMIEFGEVGQLFKVRQTAAVRNRGANVVDPLVANQVVRVPNGVEHFTHRNWRGRMLAKDPKPLLQFSRSGVLDPEKMKGLQVLAQPACLDRRQPMMAVMQQVQLL